MKVFFRCPDGEQQRILKCWTECRMGRRCAPLAYLKACAEQRAWTGKPSVTQLLNGTRLSYLLLTTDQTVSPDDLAFQTVGTGAHLSLQRRGGDGSEVGIEYEGITGIFDYVEQWGDETVLWDYKVVGSYAVAKAIGMTAQKKPLLNEDGEQMMWHGKPRTLTSFSIDPDQRDLKDWARQVNFYRIAHERGENLTVHHMFIWAVVRDGGTIIAKQRGIDHNTYLIDVPVLDDQTIIDYFTAKRDALMGALEHGVVPAQCTREEAWDGNRCKNYCPVSEECKKLGCTYLKGGDE